MIKYCSLLFPIKNSKPSDKASTEFLIFFEIGPFNKSSIPLNRSETAGQATWDNPTIDRAKGKGRKSSSCGQRNNKDQKRVKVRKSTHD